MRAEASPTIFRLSPPREDRYKGKPGEPGNGEPGHTRAPHWAYGTEMSFLTATPTERYLQHPPTSIPGGAGPSAGEWALPWSALGASPCLASGAPD